jgi:hypothetical protein
MSKLSNPDHLQLKIILMRAKKGCATRTPTPTERQDSGFVAEPKTLGKVWINGFRKELI